MNEKEFKKLNKWDLPSGNDLFGRTPFVETIVNTIKSSDKGFNMGISARWGEGKSSILKQLKPKLEALNYKVLIFEPWKYTQDKSSIKRKFIIDIYSQLDKDYDDTELYNSVEKEKKLEEKEFYDLFIEKTSLLVKPFFFTAILFLFFLFLYQTFSGVDINITETFLTNLFIPVFLAMLPFISKLTEIKIKQTLPKIESAEQFEKRFNGVIEDIMNGDNPPEKIIIFVDDLDRCNHIEVEQILTALFTFFNNENCTYVITADHTVIRRYISDFLRLDDEIDDNGTINIIKTNELKQKEATEYLKKIFQINFILPKIPSDLLEKWVKDLVDNYPIISFINPYSKDYFINLILNNFDGNPRKIKHFVRTLSFQIEAIDKKIKSISSSKDEIVETEKNNLIKVKNSPELLAKILILQDKFPDFYERLIAEPKLLKKHEEGEIAENKNLQNLLAQEPKFFNSVTRAEDKTLDPYYFLYFSGSTGFVETEIIDPSEIKSLSRSADFDNLTKIISGLTDEPRNIQVEHIKSEFDAVDIQPAEKVNVLRSLIHVVSLIEEPSLKLQKLKDIFKKKSKFVQEFLSLQSVDFDKFISFADVGLVNKFFTEDPFTQIALQNQILEAFVLRQKDIKNKKVLDRFVSGISENLMKIDANFSVFINFIKKIDDENFSKFDLIQKTLLDVYQETEDPQNLEVLNILVDRKDKLSEHSKLRFEDITLSFIENKPIQKSIAILSLIPEKINPSNFQIPRIAESFNKRITLLQNNELDQWINILIHPEIKKGFGNKKVDSIILSFIKILNDQDSSKYTCIKNRLPDLINHSENKSEILKKIVQHVAKGPIGNSTQIITILNNMTDFWKNNIELKKEFAKELKANKSKIKEISDLMVETSHNFVPPKTKRKEV